VKEKLLRNLKIQNAPVFKGQDPVWNEMALALAGAGLITTKAGAKEAGKKSCLFTIKSPRAKKNHRDPGYRRRISPIDGCKRISQDRGFIAA
jgi:hypothetical protein